MEIRGAVVVTGASSGIGRTTALLLARRGWLVFAGVRRAADGEALAATAGAIGVGGLLVPLSLDVTDATSVAAAADAVGAALAARRAMLTGLVNNAGIAVAGPIEEVPIARLRQGLEVNVIGVVAVTQAFLPLLREGSGRIINISSVAGRMAPPFLGPYAASKFALEALSDALRVELAPWGLAVVLVEPGPVTTPIWDKGEAFVEEDRLGIGDASPYAPWVDQIRAIFRRNARRGIAPDAIAEVIALALEAPRPRTRYLISRSRLAVTLLSRLAPDRLRDRLLDGRRGGGERRGGGRRAGLGGESMTQREEGSMVQREPEQFLSRGRYTVIPRTLVFLTNGDAVLLLKGAPKKRIGANRYNGLGGHLEPGETIVAGALREVWEEAGIPAEHVERFALRALVNIEGEGQPQGVLLCIFTGEATTRAIGESVEGVPEWIPIARLGEIDMVDGDRFLPRLLDEEGLLFGHQRHGADGSLVANTLE